jgi:hypothetical protein
MGTVVRTIVVIVVGLVGIALDQRGIELPAPPGWLLSWAGWILTGWALLVGLQLTQALLRFGKNH